MFTSEKNTLSVFTQIQRTNHQNEKRKTPESEMYVKDQNGQKFTAEEGISLHKEKPTNQTIWQHLPTIADCTGQLIEEVKEKKSDQKMIESPTVNADYTV